MSERATINKDKLEKAYQVHRTARDTAKALGVSHTTVNKWIKHYGITKTPDREILEIRKEKLRFGDSKARGDVAKWFRDHKGEKVHRNYKEIAQKSGASYNAVKQYFYRQRKAAKDFLNEVPDIRERDVWLYDDEAKMAVYASDIKDYWYEVDKYTIEAYIVVKTYEGEEHSFPLPDIRDFLKTVRKSTVLS